MDGANYVAGNKYRKRCVACGRWLPCCSATDWKTHDDPRVLPADSDPADPVLRPVGETEYQERIENNQFECPVDGCGERHTGYPAECGACGVEYNW